MPHCGPLLQAECEQLRAQLGFQQPRRSDSSEARLTNGDQHAFAPAIEVNTPEGEDQALQDSVAMLAGDGGEGGPPAQESA